MPLSTMTRLLKRHVFAVDAHFDRAVALSFAFPEDVVRPLVPKSLKIDAFAGMAFVTVAMVWTRDLRPAGFPRIMGQSFFLAGYRVFATLREPSGKRLRGLRILRSDTDKVRMAWAGNVFTDYRYRRVEVRVSETAGATRVETLNAVGERTLDITYVLGGDDADTPVPLPSGSPFHDWKEARRFAGPMPFTFSPEDDSTIVVIEGSRQHWEPRPIAVRSWRVGMFDESPLRDATPILANAFTVENVPYRWKRGRIVHVDAAAP
jgi:hypothetical protein